MKFDDYDFEDLGTRQKRWIDYLWLCSNLKPMRVAYCDENKHYKWTTREECVCPIDHREMLENEQVIEFDSAYIKENYSATKKVINWLSDGNYKYYVQDHSGKSPHIHLFDEDITLKHFTFTPKIDVLKLKGIGLAREIGGRYFKDKKIYYASYFKNINEIRPVTNKKDVRFPEIDLREDN